MAKYENHWYALEPLGTEGQGTSANPGKNKYSRAGTAFPFGVGMKYNLNKNIILGLEWGMRKTFTDYLDDVSSTYADPIVLFRENGSLAAALGDRSLSKDTQSHIGLQRGNSRNKDWYSFAGLIITVKLHNKAETCPIYKPHYNYKREKLYGGKP